MSAALHKAHALDHLGLPDSLDSDAVLRSVPNVPSALSTTPHDRSTPSNRSAHDPDLSPREAQILMLIAHGLDNHQIAASLYLSINTVKTYIRTCYRRIRVTSRTQAVLWAIQHGMRPDIVVVPPRSDRS